MGLHSCTLTYQFVLFKKKYRPNIYIPSIYGLQSSIEDEKITYMIERPLQEKKMDESNKMPYLLITSRKVGFGSKDMHEIGPIGFTCSQYVPQVFYMISDPNV